MYSVISFVPKILSITRESRIKLLENPPHPNFIERLSQIISALDIYLDTSSQDSECEDFCVKIYDTVHLDSGEILRTSSEFQAKEWFSNVTMTSAKGQRQYNSNEGAWYEKVSNI